MKHRSSMIICTVLMISSIFSIFPAISGTATDLSDCILAGSDDICIVSDTYLAGTKSISVFSNLTVKKYDFLVNGTSVRNQTNTVVNRTGYWKPSYITFDYGTGTTGNIRNLDLLDNVNLSTNSQSSAGDRWVRFYLYFSSADLPVSLTSIVSTRYETKVGITGTAPDLVRTLDVYNYTTAAWQNLHTFGATGSTYNQSVPDLQNEMETLTKTIRMRYYFRTSSTANTFTINTDLARIYYVSNVNIPNPSGGFATVDSFSFNTTTYTNGLYNFTARITTPDNVVHQKKINVVIDNTKPTISSISVSPTNPDDDTPVNVYATISDTNLLSSRGSYTNSFGKTIEIPNGNNQIFNFTTYLSNGSYTFSVFAIDECGNMKSSSVSFNVSKVSNYIYLNNPSIEISYESNEYIDANATFFINCTEIVNITVYRNFTFLANYTSFPVYFNVTSSNETTLFITVLYWRSNGTLFQNKTYTVKFSKKVVYYTPSTVISRDKSAYVGDNITMSLITNNTGKLDVYRNGSLVYTFTGNGTFAFNHTYGTPAEFSYRVEVFDTCNVSFSNVTFITTFLAIPLPVVVYSSMHWSLVLNNKTYLPEPVRLNITTYNISNVYVYVNSSLNATFAGNSTDVLNINFTSACNATIDVVFQFTNGTNFTVSTAIEALQVPITYVPVYMYSFSSWSIFLNNETYLPDPISMNITTNNASAVYIYVNATLNATFAGNSSDVHDIYFTSACNATIGVVIQSIDGTNTTLYFNVSVMDIPVNNTNVYSSAYWYLVMNNVSYIPDPIFMNITTYNTTAIYIYVNSTLNATFAGNSTIYHDIYFTSACNATIDVVFEMTDGFNITITKPVSVKDLPVTYIDVYSNTDWWISIKNITYLPDPISMTISTTNFTSVYIYVNSTLNATFAGNSTFDHDIYFMSACNATVDVVFEMTNGTNITRTFQVSVASVPISYVPVDVYSTVTWTAVIVNETYIPDPIHVFVATYNATAVYIKVNSTLNATFSGNTTIDHYINFTSPCTATIDIIIQLVNGTNVTISSDVSVLSIPYIIDKKPSALISLFKVDDDVSIHVETIDSNKTILLVDGMTNTTFGSNVSTTMSIYNVSVGYHNFTFNVHDNIDAFYFSRSIYLNVTMPVNVTMVFPSFFIVFPSSILANNDEYIMIYVNESNGMNIVAKDVNGVLSNVTETMDGSYAYLVPSSTNREYVNYTITIYDSLGDVYQVIELQVNIIVPITTTRFLVINYENIVYSGQKFTVYGDANFVFDVLLQKDGTQVFKKTSVTSFLFSTTITEHVSQLTYTTTIKANGSMIYNREIVVYVFKQSSYIVPPGITVVWMDQWTVFIAAAISVVAVLLTRRFYIARCERKVEEAKKQKKKDSFFK